MKLRHGSCLVGVWCFCSVACMPPKKKVKRNDELVARAASNSGCGVQTILAAFRNNGTIECSVREARLLAHKSLYELPSTQTPFGPIALTTKVMGMKRALDIYHVNPVAFLYHALVLSRSLCVFLDACQSSNPEGVLTIALYLDEATPGNQNRPDRGRASQCCYWTILEFPPWFISRSCGWLPFAFVLCAEMIKAGLTDSMHWMARPDHLL